MSDERRWLSAHLHFDGTTPRDFDRVIQQVVKPLTRGLESRDLVHEYFFIRYFENGPHVRVRWLPVGSEAADEIRRTAEGASAEAYRNGKSAGPLTLRWQPYEPEVERYGGVVAIQQAERLFWRSSRTVFDLLEDHHDERAAHGTRMGVALLSMVVLAHAAEQSLGTPIGFLGFYSRAYMPVIAAPAAFASLMSTFGRAYETQADRLVPHVHELWLRLEGNEPLGGALDEYAVSVRQYLATLRALFADGAVIARGAPPASWSRCVQQIVPSLMHMHNNRLGITIPEEVYLAVSAHRALQSVIAADLSA